jgi:hypothetical protein
MVPVLKSTRVSMKNIFAILLFSTLSFEMQAQTFVFKMILFGDSVGLSTITKTRDANGIDNYVLDSHIRGKVLWITRENRTHYESRYKDGKLISATYYEINNGKKDKWSNIQWDGRSYQVETYHGKKSFTEVPVHSIGPMYCDGFNPSKKRFFYEPEGDFNEVSYTSPNTLEYKSSDGYRNVFIFKNGQIADAEFHTTLATVYLKRIK